MIMGRPSLRNTAEGSVWEETLEHDMRVLERVGSVDECAGKPHAPFIDGLVCSEKPSTLIYGAQKSARYKI